MWIRQFFSETEIDFKGYCRRRIGISSFLILLGVMTLVMLLLMKGRLPVLYLEPNSAEFRLGFYRGSGFALIAAGLITLIRHLRYLKREELGQKKKVELSDERNRLLGLRCWAFAGYCMFLFLYIGILISGFVSVLIMKILLCILAMYALLLLIFRTILNRAM